MSWGGGRFRGFRVSDCEGVGEKVSVAVSVGVMVDVAEGKGLRRVSC